MTKLSIEPDYSYIAENIKRVEERIARAAEKSGLGIPVNLVGVTKTIDEERISYAIKNGVSVIGENKVQEFLEKKDGIDFGDCKKHLIGHLQTNKVKKIVGQVDMIQSVDSVKLASMIGKYSAESGITTDILLQINSGNEENKFGFTADEIEERCHETAGIEGVKVCGLMCVAPICEKDSEIRNIFSNIFKKFIDIQGKNMDNIKMKYLSMGMSGDFENAILEGSNMVRVGSAIFGAREYR